jgi:hypothetical protein
VADVEWTALWLGSTGMIGPDTLALFLIGLPTLAVGTSAALKLFGKQGYVEWRGCRWWSADADGCRA